ncbi:MAG: hypothetical protein KC416_16195, partial [Myxococcales bacterium]|nr:hypothetical protein [Myxococcales bacterium]
ALIGSPELIILDEPTSGLDPEGRDVLLDLVAQIPERTGASVLLSTHILPDVERTCDQVVVLADGTVRYAGDLAPLLRSKDDRFEVRVSGSAEAFKEHLEQVGCLVTAVADALEVRPPAGQGTSLILARAEETGAQVRHLAPLRMTLERAFFETLESDPSQGSPSP